MTISCEYCANKKCACGGKRKLSHQPVPEGSEGEVKIHCCKCGCTWLHWHKKISKNKTQGTARPM